MPVDWKNASFKTLRAEGAYLVSAIKENGGITEVKINAEAAGLMQLKLPFKTFYIKGVKNNIIYAIICCRLFLKRKESVLIENGFEK